MRGYRRLLRYLRPHWRALLCVIGTTVLASAVALLEPWPLKVLIDNILGDKPRPGWLETVLSALPGSDGQRDLLFWIVVASVLIFVVELAFIAVNAVLTATLSQRMTYRLGGDLFMHLQRLSPLFHHRRAVGDTVARVTVDPSCVSTLVMQALVPALGAAFTIVSMFVIMFRLEPTLALLSLAVAPFMIVTIRVFADPLKRRSRRRRDLEGEVMSVVERTLTAIPAVQAFNREDTELARFQTTADGIVDAYRRATTLSMVFKLLIGGSTAVGTAILMYVGGVYALEGKLTVGTLVVFLAYLKAMYDPLNKMTYSASTIQYAFAQADRVLEIMDTEPDVQDAPGARSLRIEGTIRYEDVSFAYEPGRPVLQDVSLEARPGDIIAIVGPTGAGKTTLVNLLPRFFDPDEGRITIDGVDLRQIKVRCLREQVALVLQDPYILPLSIQDNIAYGRPDATRREVLAAARAANVDAFARRLPKRYATVIGERGATLSGGEQQRLAIARAFLKDAPILILDEPTSALDARTESMLLDALNRLMEGRVTFVIAHRLSTIRDARQILVLDEGRVIERGSHAELLAGGGLYAALYRRQLDLADHDGPVEIRGADMARSAAANSDGNGAAAAALPARRSGARLARRRSKGNRTR